MPKAQERRLDSWKEIAGYLDRDVSTAMRWEKSLGMPVHRLPGSKKGASVFAYPSELDNWLSGLDEPAAGRRPSSTSVKLAPRFWLILGIGVVSMIVWGWLTIRSDPGAISRVDTVGDAVVTRKLNDQIAWTYQHPRGYTFATPQESLIMDLFGDSEKELLLAANVIDPLRQQHMEAELHCFEANGTLRWRLTIGDILQFGAGTFTPPWVLADFQLLELNGEPTIILSTHHYTWWPGLVLAVDRDGQRRGKFINSGWILASDVLHRPQGDRLLLGGISNSKRAAVLAVLDSRHLAGTSPEEPGSEFECRDCPPGKPLRYFVFPPTEVNRAGGLAFNQVLRIELTDSGIRVGTREGSVTSDVEWIYQFSTDFELLQVTPSDSYWARHRVMSDGHLIDHSVDECPEQTPPPIFSWTPEKGWTELNPTGLDLTPMVRPAG